jgi:hypothetical protein
MMESLADMRLSVFAFSTSFPLTADRAELAEVDLFTMVFLMAKCFTRI